MKLELNLIENSYDYINNSFELYKVADEYGIHDAQKSKFDNKIKWKLAFVTMVQAVELLLKECLFRVHANLIYDDIDSEKVNDRKTVSFQQAINRINNLYNNLIEEESRIFLMKCSIIRNEFIHYKVDVQSESLKSKYCTLYTIYKDLHSKVIGNNISLNDNVRYTEIEILEYNEKWSVFRGDEIRKEELEELKKQIEINSKYNYYSTKTGKKIKRIRYGDEITCVSEPYKLSNDCSVLIKYDICDDCSAKIGEFHLDGCDFEVCPVCFGQIITCGCIDVEEDGILKKLIE